jgi:hypothetical protein
VIFFQQCKSFFINFAALLQRYLLFVWKPKKQVIDKFLHCFIFNVACLGIGAMNTEKIMKKIIFFATVLFVAIGANAQKIKTNEVDKFTKNKIIETSFEKIVSDKSILGSTGGRLMKDVWIAFRQVGDNTYLRLKWCTNTVLALSKNADIIFLDSDGNTYTFKNTEFTLAGEGQGTVGVVGSALYGLDIYMVGDCAALKDKSITDMRINTTDGYIDFKLNKKASGTISKTFKVFENAINNIKKNDKN